MNARSTARGLRNGVLVALLILPGCHDYALFDHYAPPDEPAPSSGAAQTPASAGARGGERFQGGVPGTVSEAGGSTGGVPATDWEGAVGGDAGHSVPEGEAGAAGEGSVSADVGLDLPSLLGTVLVRAGSKTCSGTLQTNAWVLTVGHCIPSDVEASDVSVSLGSNRESPREVAQVQEIARFGETGELRDLALLRLAHPFTINGSSAGYRRSFYPLDSSYLQGARLYCLGWDFDPSAGDATTTQAETLEVDEIEPGTALTSGSGVTLWLANVTSDEMVGTSRITQPADEGGGCFISVGADWHLVAVQLESSASGPDGLLGNSLRARAASLTDSATRHWLVRTMLGHAPVVGVTPSRGLGSVLDADRNIALLWIDAAGKMWRAPQSEVAASEQLGSPDGVGFVAQRPAGASYGEQLLVAAYGSDGQLWYRLVGGSSPTQWTVVGTAIAPLGGASLVNVGGVVNLFALGSAHELRQTWFDGTWQDWIFLDGYSHGTPSVSSPGPGRIDVVTRGGDGDAWVHPWQDGTWYYWYSTGIHTLADPLVIDDGIKNDIFTSGADHQLVMRWFDSYWLSEGLNLGIVTGSYITGLSRVAGSYDLFLSDGESVTHAWWPR